MSASTTKLCPWLPATRIASRACVALLLGRNPYLHNWKSASKIGSSTIFVAICTTRSRTVGIPNGRCFPGSFGMYRRLTGSGRYRPSRSAAWISAKNSPTPRCSIAWIVSASTPAAPRLRRTRLHASHRTSLLQIRSYNAWKRRVLLCLAHTYSLRWSSRTFSLGVLAISGMPSHLPPGKPDQSRAPSLQRVILHAFAGNTDPSDSLPAPPAFGLRPYTLGLYLTRLPDRVSPVPHCSFPACRRLRPRGESRIRSGPECCLLPSP